MSRRQREPQDQPSQAQQDQPAQASRPVPSQAPRRYTSASLTAGVLVAAACFVVALAAEIVRGSAGSGEMADIAAVLDGLVAFSPWAWAAAGVYAVVATPFVGLIVTAGEYASVGERRTAGLAIAVIAVLGASAAVAVLR